jgi:uncharacterized protein with von Willebrand factor type A (vWA) domain
MFRRGAENQQGDRMKGLRDLMDQLKQRRRENLDRHNMSSILDDIKERLENVLKQEREGIQQRVQEGRDKVEASKSGQTSETGEAGEAGQLPEVHRIGAVTVFDDVGRGRADLDLAERRGGDAVDLHPESRTAQRIVT